MDEIYVRVMALESGGDRTLFTLRAEDIDGRPIAFLINYTMHSVCTIWNDFDRNGAMGLPFQRGKGCGCLCRF